MNFYNLINALLVGVKHIDYVIELKVNLHDY